MSLTLAASSFASAACAGNAAIFAQAASSVETSSALARATGSIALTSFTSTTLLEIARGIASSAVGALRAPFACGPTGTEVPEPAIGVSMVTPIDRRSWSHASSIAWNRRACQSASTRACSSGASRYPRIVRSTCSASPSKRCTAVRPRSP